MGLTDILFFEDECIADWVSRSLLGTAESEGSPAKLTRFFRLWERTAPATGLGRGRDSWGAGHRAIPRRPSRAASRSAGRAWRENTPPVEKNTILLCYTVYMPVLRIVKISNSKDRHGRSIMQRGVGRLEGFRMISGRRD